MSGRPRTTSFAEQNKQANQHPILGMKVTSKYHPEVLVIILSTRCVYLANANRVKRTVKSEMCKRSRMMERAKTIQRTPSEHQQVKMAAEKKERGRYDKKKLVLRA